MAVTTIEIETNVPIPPKKNGPNTRYPFALLQPGESFIAHASRESVNSCKRYWERQLPGWSFTTRNMDGGIRVWRVA